MLLTWLRAYVQSRFKVFESTLSCLVLVSIYPRRSTSAEAIHFFQVRLHKNVIVYAIRRCVGMYLRKKTLALVFIKTERSGIQSRQGVCTVLGLPQNVKLSTIHQCGASCPGGVV
jgi:hypothetical protein